VLLMLLSLNVAQANNGNKKQKQLQSLEKRRSCALCVFELLSQLWIWLGRRGEWMGGAQEGLRVVEVPPKGGLAE
jgi:hypothetical protein